MKQVLGYVAALVAGTVVLGAIVGILFLPVVLMGVFG